MRWEPPPRWEPRSGPITRATVWTSVISFNLFIRRELVLACGGEPIIAIIAYADDFFPVWPSPPVGFPAPQQPLFQLLPGVIRGAANHLYLQDYPQLDFKGRSYANTPALQMTFQGLAPGLVGVEQINFVVPVNQQPGDWALFFNIGSCPDGGDPPSRCGNFGSSSPYVKLPVR